MISDRISTILDERNLRVKEFANAIGISPNYVSMLKTGKKDTVSETAAMLIQEKYGYSKEWILTGNGPKEADSNLSYLKKKLLNEIAGCSDEEIAALLAFSRSLTEVRSLLAPSIHETKVAEIPDKPYLEEE